MQFHPEVFHSTCGTRLLSNFVKDICGSKGDWNADAYIETTVAALKQQLGNDKVVLGLSGGVDSSVAAVLISRAIGDNLTCIFVDHGLLRKDEFAQVMNDYRCLGLNVIGVDASEEFFAELKDVKDPERKRKIIGKGFIDVFDREAHKLKDVKWLAQGTIYPDRIESLSITGTTIKSHHNVGGLPEKMNLSLCEPLQWLFKDEVRAVGRALGMPEHLITRHPFRVRVWPCAFSATSLPKRFVSCKKPTIYLSADCANGVFTTRYGKRSDPASRTERRCNG